MLEVFSVFWLNIEYAPFWSIRCGCSKIVFGEFGGPAARILAARNASGQSRSSTFQKSTYEVHMTSQKSMCISSEILVSKGLLRGSISCYQILAAHPPDLCLVGRMNFSGGGSLSHPPFLAGGMTYFPSSCLVW